VGDGWFISPTVYAGVINNLQSVYRSRGNFRASACRHSLRVAAALEAGQVYVNEYLAHGVETPLGGFKNSGYGREKGIEALHHYTQLKSVTIKL
jgi:acyl-CoA reductase-like NAD-dependent aldehyde dehydrogenase